MLNKKYIWFSVVCFIILFGAIMLLNGGMSREDKNRIKTEEYNAVFFSMYDISGYKEEDFLTYRGLETICLESRLKNFTDITRCFDRIWQSNRTVETIYLGIDPVQLLEKSSGKEHIWMENMNAYLGSIIQQHPEVTFEILLPSPHISYWTQMKEDKFTKSMNIYQKTVDLLKYFVPENVLTDLETVHQMLKEILEDIKLCLDKNNLPFLLDGGTLIGACRKSNQ